MGGCEEEAGSGSGYEEGGCEWKGSVQRYWKRLELGGG